jgi:hypothetical protein
MYLADIIHGMNGIHIFRNWHLLDLPECLSLVLKCSVINLATKFFTVESEGHLSHNVTDM